MKKITLLLSVIFIMAFGFSASAQFSCDTGVAITDGFTATGITTPGTGGIEDWNDPNPAGCDSNAFYWDDDVYLYQYTAGANDEEISMTIFTRNGWNGIGIFSDCTGTALEGCLASANSIPGDVSQNVISIVNAGETVYIAIGQWGTPDDLDFDVTSFVATPLVDPPSCSVVLSPADGAIDVLETEAITWDQALGGATGYFISIGTSSGGTEVLNNFDVGNVLTYTPSPPLNYSTEYFVTITPYNLNGNASDCVESSFTLRDAPPEGSTCGNPIEVTALPYSTDDDTINYGDDYTGAPGDNCGSASGYLGGDDVVYAYTPTVDTSVTITMTPGGTWSGLFIYTDCADIGTTCAEGIANASDDVREIVLPVTAGTTYYIVISTFPAPQNITYNLTITENSCTNPDVVYDVRGDCATAPQFFVDVIITNLGSAGTITVSDDQGSTPQTINAIGLVSFGPFANTTPVVITVANDDDINCILTSPILVQEFCQDYVVDCNSGPVNTTFCYFNNIDDDPSVATFTYTSSDGSPLNFTINAGQMEGCCDELVIIDSDGTELFNQNVADPSGINFQSSGDTISWYINSDGSVSCEDNGYTPFDVTVSCATCVNPVATYDVRSDCDTNPQFFVDVDVTDLGSAGTVTLSDDQGSAPQTISATGLVSFGPFDNNIPVVITVANDDDVNCSLTSPILTQQYCLDNIVDCSSGPVNTTFCYFNNIDDDPSVATFTYTSSDGSPLNFTINAGQMEGCCDELVIIDSDGTELFNQNVADPSGINFQSSGDTISWYINSDGSVSCEDNGYTPFDVTVSCATCVNPVATYDVRSDCQTSPQFYVDVDVTDLGSAGTVTLSDDQGSAPQTISAIGLVSFGPFDNNIPIVITVANDDDVNCTLTSPILTQEYCLDNIVDCDSGPTNTTFCYFNNIDDDPSVATFTYTSSNGLPLNFTINAGQMEGCCDELVIIDSDGTELFNQNVADPSGITFQSSGDTISWYINSDGSVSCEDNGYTPFDVTVSCATCINPAATYQVVDDCDNGDQFLIDVIVTSLGDADSLTISNNIDASTEPVTAVGTYQIGPFPFLVDVVVTLSNDQDVNCVINSSPIQLLACPPPNDNPCNATEVVVNDGILCEVRTPGSLIEATDSGLADPSCGGTPDDDVWFQFEANSESHLIALANIAGSNTTDVDHSVYSGDCNNLTEIACVSNFEELTSVASGLTIGDTYYIRVYSGGTNNETTTFDVCITPYIAPANVECDLAEDYCSGSDASDILYSYNTINVLPGFGSIDCLGTSPNPTFSLLRIATSGDILIEMVQNGAFDENDNPIGQELDVDFILWGPYAPGDPLCDGTNIGLGPIVDCSYSPAPVENVTLNGAVAGEIYLLLITNFDQDAGVIQVRQTNAGDTGAGTTVADLEVDLGPDQSFCGFPDFTIDANSPSADTYEWYANGFLIPGETGSTLTVTTTDTYTVIAYNDGCDAEAMDSVTIIFGQEAMANPVPDIVTCDDMSGDEIEDFDLEIRTDEVLGTQSADDFNVTYHLSLTDAQNGDNPLMSPFTNTMNPQTIYIRVEDANADFCFATTSFDLIISGPTPTALADIYPECDDDLDGIAAFDLPTRDANILDGQSATDYAVSYYETLADAEAGNNPIDTSMLYNSATTTIYARVESTIAFDCYETTTVELIVNPSPDSTFVLMDLITCDDASGDEVEDFDLEIQTPVVLGTQNPADFNVTYHLTLIDAQLGMGALTSLYTNISNPQTIYVRIENGDATTCYVTASFDLIISGPRPDATNVPIEACEDDIIDGVAYFDLAAHDGNILNGQDATIFTVTYYETEADAEAGTSPIDTSVLYESPSQTIYARVTSNVSFGCYSTTPFDLIVKPLPRTSFSTDFDYEVCPNATVPIQITATPENYTISEVSIVWYRDGGVISGETGLTLSVLEEGLYEIQVTFNDSTMCSETVSQQVVELESCVIPQGISPNGDGSNDTFDLSSYDVSKLEIFNRNGTLVYSKTNYNNEWYGQSNDGEELPVGTYFYTMEYKNGKRRAAWVYIQRLN